MPFLPCLFQSYSSSLRHSIAVDVDEHASVKQVLEQLGTASGRLLFSGKELRHGDTLTGSGVTMYSTLSLVAPLCGGGQSSSQPRSWRPARVFVFHDAENCPLGGPGIGRVDGSKVYDATVRAAVRCAGNYFGVDGETLASQANLLSEVLVRWELVLRHDPSNVWHPRPSVLKDLQNRGVQHVDPGQKADAVDTQIKSMLLDFIPMHSDFSEDVKQRTVVVLLAGDGDYAAEVRALRREGFTVVILHRGNSRKAFLDLIPEQCRCNEWDRILHDAALGRSRPPPVDRAPLLRFPLGDLGEKRVLLDMLRCGDLQRRIANISSLHRAAIEGDCLLVTPEARQPEGPLDRQCVELVQRYLAAIERVEHPLVQPLAQPTAELVEFARQRHVALLFESAGQAKRRDEPNSSSTNCVRMECPPMWTDRAIVEYVQQQSGVRVFRVDELASGPHFRNVKVVFHKREPRERRRAAIDSLLRSSSRGRQRKADVRVFAFTDRSPSRSRPRRPSGGLAKGDDKDCERTAILYYVRGQEAGRDAVLRRLDGRTEPQPEASGLVDTVLQWIACIYFCNFLTFYWNVLPVLLFRLGCVLATLRAMQQRWALYEKERFPLVVTVALGSLLLSFVAPPDWVAPIGTLVVGLALVLLAVKRLTSG